MRKLKYWLLLAAFGLSACQAAAPTETKPVATPAPAATAATTATNATGAQTAAGHEHSAPHGGALIELGEEFAHLELVLDSATGQMTAYALDGEAEKAVRLQQPDLQITVLNPATMVKLSGRANSLTGETANETSEFVGTSEALKGVSAFEGTVRALTIKGQQFKSIKFKYPKGSDSE